MSTALDDLAHHHAKEPLDLVECEVRVLDGVMEQAGDECDLLHLRLGEDARHLDWVGDVRLAAPPPLPVVRQK